jgi:uncharacterized protein
MPDLLPRLITPAIESALTVAPVVVLEGGRATGKSTVCDELIRRRRWPARLDMSDEATRETLLLDPVRFLTTQPTPCVVDEAQLVPDLTVWVKRVVDARHSPGQFVLTGSARLGRHQLGGSDPLAGRSVRLQMSSMTRAERSGRLDEPAAVQRAFGDGWHDVRGQTSTWSFDGDLRGGLPGIPGVLGEADAAQWERAMAAYVEAVIPLGVGDARADLGRLLRTFRYFAANSGQIANFARAAGELGVQAPTVKAHLELLEASFLLMRLEAERPTEHRVVTAHPRIFATDTGLAAWASRAWAADPPSAATVGALAETAVTHDVSAQTSASTDRIVVRHWRDNRSRQEVDVLLVHPDGRYVAVEVKASTTVRPGDARGLIAFGSAHADRCQRCILIYHGTTVVDLTPAGLPCEVVAVPRAMT